MLPVLAGPRSLRRIFRAVTSVYVIGSASDARCRVRCKKNDRWHITNILVGRRSALASGPKTLQQWPSLRLQSSFVDDQDNLWILDPAAPKQQEIVKGGPKLVKVDLTTNNVVQTIPFGEDVAPAKSYLNDVRIDTATNTAFITESGKGAIIVVELKSGKARRLLDGHKSTQPEKNVKLTVDGKQLIDQQKKSPPQVASDGIALDMKNGYLYYHALTGHTLYRIKTSFLTDEKLSKSDLESNVETVAKTPAPDGMLEAPDGSIYLTDLEDSAIVRLNVATNKIDKIIADKRLLWPDTLSWGPGGELYVTASQIENMPRFNNGKSARTEPYKLFKIVGL